MLHHTDCKVPPATECSYEYYKVLQSPTKYYKYFRDEYSYYRVRTDTPKYFVVVHVQVHVP